MEECNNIKIFLWQNCLSNNWMISQLKKRGLCIDKSTFSEALNGRCKNKKAELIISTSADIMQLYLKNFADIKNNYVNKSDEDQKNERKK